MTYSNWAVSLSLVLAACSDPGLLDGVGGAPSSPAEGQAGGDVAQAGTSGAGAEGGNGGSVVGGGSDLGPVAGGGSTGGGGPTSGSSIGGTGGSTNVTPTAGRPNTPEPTAGQPNGGTGGSEPVPSGGSSIGGGGAGGTTSSMGGMGGSLGAHEPALPGSNGLIYGYGGGSNYLAGIEIQCQKPNPSMPWKYGEPHFEIRSPVDHSTLASKIPCGGRAWDLNLSIKYIVLGYEGDMLLVSTGFLPGSVVTIQMP